MKPKIPQGGFFVAKKNSEKVSDLIASLERQGYETLSFESDNLVLASLKEFDGQGIWSGESGAITYDIDLTNITALQHLVGLQDENPGKLLLALYEKYGVGFIDKLRGAFGIALWDCDKKKLIVATDPFGIRPVVYASKAGDYIAASRIRSLLLDHTVSRQINLDAIYHYLFFHAICSPLTIYSSVHKLGPGKGHQFDRGDIKEFCHYDIKYDPDYSLSERDWTKSIFREVEKAVNLYVTLSSINKTGCFLSGGTDSSTIAGLYTKLSGFPAQTFSIGFDDPKYNELHYAKLAVERFKTLQREYFVTPEDTLQLISELPHVYDEPFGNASVVPAYFCAFAAKEKGVDFLLGGDGGDEIFGGNERYVTNLVFERYFLLPAVFRRMLLEPLIGNLPKFGLVRKASRYVRRANFSNPDRFYSYNLLAETDNREVLTDSFLRSVNTSAFIDIARSHYQNAAPAHDTDRLLYLDMKFTITDNDLRKVTQMAESAGIRVRYPYLDRDLVDFTTKIPPEFKVKYGKNRYIFKQAMEGFLPKEIIEKPKHGMGLPISNWFRKEKILSDLLSDYLFSGQPKIISYLKPTFLESIYKDFRRDETTAYFGDTLWVYLVLELWLRNHG